MSTLTAVSLFAGIGGIDLALERAGVRVVAAVEIDPGCRGVLARQFPDAQLFDDVRTVTADELTAAGFVPGRGVLTGGFPCQDLSIAGRRTGLGGARSGLFWEVMRLADELSPRWILLENVPGLLSAVCSCPGDDSCTYNGRAVRCGQWRTERDPSHAAVDLGPVCPECGHDWEWHDAGGFCNQCQDTCESLPPVKLIKVWYPNVPHGVKGGACHGGCMARHGGAMGAVLGALGKRGYGFAYRVLDAQFFGVPQRRSRVFIAGCLGERAAPVEVLLEPESGNGNPAAGGAARAVTAGRAGGGAGDAGVTGTLTAGMLGDYDDNTARAGFMVAHSTGAGWWTEGPGTLRAQGGGADQGGHLVVPALTAAMGSNVGHPGDAGKDEMIAAVTAATLQGGGRRGHRVDAEGAVGGHLVVAQNGSDIQVGEQFGALTAGMARQTSGDLVATPVISHAITARERKGADSDATSGIITTAFPLAMRGRNGGAQLEAAAPGDPAFALRAGDGGSSRSALIAHSLTSEGADASEDGTGRGTPLVTVAFATSSLDNPRGDGLAPSVKANRNGQDTGSGASVMVATPMAVRRLTPLECERLQGFPDGWTAHLADGTAQSDSARYRQCGNAVAVPCVEWITRRLVAADQLRTEAAA